MKKLLALSMAAMMMAMVAPVKAAEADTGKKDVETTDETSEQNGEIWATISQDPLSQLKVTMPIRIDFSVTPGTPETDGGTADPKNVFVVGDYKIKVSADSDIGVELTGIKVTNAENGNWTLTNAAGIETTETAITESSTTAEKQAVMKTVALNIAGTDLKYGDNTISNFIVGKATDKSLAVSGTATKATIESMEAKAEKAFNVVYTIKQNNTKDEAK